ncbi:hypothetical protein IV203_027678 [Nitzschia inconspicua]|uniref:Uncharacterized protein n=1 Tax=Nitzschia inconspicua TaxID=303405 RepID=A0A9K3LX48_9STRA|nr:hypothetical protein IV203_027678 [Nitzschia inconspicua]
MVGGLNPDILLSRFSKLFKLFMGKCPVHISAIDTIDHNCLSISSVAVIAASFSSSSAAEVVASATSMFTTSVNFRDSFLTGISIIGELRAVDECH